MFSPQNTTLICPKNDLESQTIVEIAKKLNMDVRVSEQGWGARLDKEAPENLKNLKRNVWIVEIPGPEKEGELRHDGHDVSVIDHHNYQGLNRFCELSSLEQFAKKIQYELNGEERLIAINDSSYIWGLIDAGVSFEKIRDIRRKDLLAQGWKEEDFTNNEKEYDAMKETIPQFVSQPGPIFFHETNLKKTGHLVDLFHMPDEAHYDSFKTSLDGYARVNILLVKKSEGLTMDFSGKRVCRDVVLTHFFPLADNYWLGGRGEFGFAGFKMKSEHGLSMIHDKLNSISVELIKEDSMCHQVRRLHDASIQKFTSFFVFPFSFSKKKDKAGHGWSQKHTFPIPVEENQLGEKWEFQQNYAEYIYFHDYVRSFLFPQRDKESCKESDQGSSARVSEDFLTFYNTVRHGYCRHFVRMIRNLSGASLISGRALCPHYAFRESKFIVEAAF